MEKGIKTIGVFTSGGDAPGMNAAIRSVVRSSLYYGFRVKGIYNGFEGMIKGEIKDLQADSVSNIIQRGGTILKTARSKRFMQHEGMEEAYRQLQKHEVDALIAIGGDGTFKGADEFEKLFNIPIIGLPGTIDNDLFGTDFTIGYDTAINTVIEAVDKIRDTATSFGRLFFIEVMGRDAGFIALRSGIAVGAEFVVIPETKTHIEDLINTLDNGWKREKTSSIVIVAEGDDSGGALKLAEMVSKKFDYNDIRVTILGHIQRGGSPSCMDRVLASRMGMEAVIALKEGRSNVMVGIINKEEVNYVPFEKAAKHHNKVNKGLIELVQTLSSV